MEPGACYSFKINGICRFRISLCIAAKVGLSHTLSSPFRLVSTAARFRCLQSVVSFERFSLIRKGLYCARINAVCWCSDSLVTVHFPDRVGHFCQPLILLIRNENGLLHPFRVFSFSLSRCFRFRLVAISGFRVN